MFTVTVRVSGAGRLADFRERLRALMVLDPDAEDYTEHHAEGLLEYRFEPAKGIPFPAFAEVSAEFPELRVEAQWSRDGVGGRALIECGQLVEQDVVDEQAAALEVEVDSDARLLLGFVCEADGEAIAGYAATCERQTYFRFRDGTLELIDPQDADAALEELAFAFVEEWIWFDEESDAPAQLERTRYQGYGHPVRGANLKSEKLAYLRRSGGRISTLNEAGRKAREALAARWLETP